MTTIARKRKTPRERIIIDNRSGKPVSAVLPYVERIIKEGRISECEAKPQFCYHTIFASGIHVSVFKNRKSERFLVYTEHTQW